MMYNIATFKNVFQYQMAKFNNAKLQLFFTNLIVQPQTWRSQMLCGCQRMVELLAPDQCLH